MRSIWFLDCLVRMPSPAGPADGSYAMHETTAPAGSQPPPHVHHREDEGFYVVEGELTLFTPDGSRTLRSGEAANAPRGVPHTYRAGPAGVRMLVVTAPAGFEDFILEVGVPAERDELPAPAGPPDDARLSEIAARHGIELVGPPGALPAPADRAPAPSAG